MDPWINFYSALRTIPMESVKVDVVRTVTAHEVAGIESKLLIVATDLPGAAGVNQHYEIYGMDTERNGSDSKRLNPHCIDILFQDGPTDKNGVNGVTIEALLAVCADRLESYYKGPLASKETAKALEAIYTALNTLKQRTLDRVARNVEGKKQI
jgi:hypothetical protein